MLAFTDPREAYRRSEIEARIQGVGDPGELVRICIDQVVGGLGLALITHKRPDPTARSKALSRALSALIALEMGVDQSAPLAPALMQLYGAAKKAILDSVVTFDEETLGHVRADFVEIGRSLKSG